MRSADAGGCGAHIGPGPAQGVMGTKRQRAGKTNFCGMEQTTATRRKGFPLFIFLIFVAIASPQRAAAQDAPSVEGVKFHPSDSLIQTLVLISSKDSVKYSLIVGADSGVKTLQIYSGEKIINRKECYGAKDCRLAGVTPSAALQSDILTVEALSSDGKEQKEKIKMNLEQGGDKVYMITALPGMDGRSVDHIANATGTVTTATNTTGIEITIPADTGPVITFRIERKEKNTYDLLVVSADPRGVDFVELLQNGRFFDVQDCENLKQCNMNKTIVVKNGDQAKIAVKSMNKNAKVSVQDIPLTFED